MKAIILAAGYATRLYPLTIDQPKALLPIGGRPMLGYLCDAIAGVEGMNEVHLVTNHRFEGHFRRWAEEAAGEYPGLRFVIWDDGTTSDGDKLGAVGDIGFVIDRANLGDDVLVAASDNFFTFPLRYFVDDFRRHGKDTVLAARFKDEDKHLLTRFAVATLDSDNRVLDMVEKPKVPPTDIGIYALYLYRRDTLPLFKDYLDSGASPDAPGHFPEWLCRRREVRAYLFEGECVDIGTPQSYKEICERMDRGDIVPAK